MNPTTPLRIDIDAVIQTKNPALARWMPRCVTSYVKRIVHQDEVNDTLERFASLDPVAFTHAALQYLGITYTAVGLERIPRDGRYIFAGNHPFGGMDGMMLVDELSTYFGSAKVIVNDILMNIAPLAPLFIPVNKHGKQSAEYARSFREALLSTEQIATFPAGLCSRRTKGVICDSEWKPTFVRNAIESRRAIVPVFFDGRLSSFFYNLSSLRRTLGIRANIEMFYLADEMFKQKGRHFNIYFGEPVSCEQLSDGASPKAWATKIKEQVYALPACYGK